MTIPCPNVGTEPARPPTVTVDVLKVIRRLYQATEPVELDEPATCPVCGERVLTLHRESRGRYSWRCAGQCNQGGDERSFLAFTFRKTPEEALEIAREMFAPAPKKSRRPARKPKQGGGAEEVEGVVRYWEEELGDGAPVMTSHGRVSLRLFLHKLGRERVEDSMRIAARKVREPAARWKFFCGVAWNRIREREGRSQ